MYAIEIENLSKTFKGPRFNKFEALKHLDLAVEMGEVFGFLGPNGAGKSTTIKSIMGLITPTAGNISICGIPSTDSASRKVVGYLPENPSYYDQLTACEYLSFVGKMFGMQSSRIAAEMGNVLMLLGLKEAADRPIRTYSKGMVQRLGIAQALLHDPDVFIFDEPMSGLDPLGRSLVKDIISEMKKRGKCVFFSTHITSDVELICDRVGILLHGELQLVERVDEILSRGITGYSIRTAQENSLPQQEIYAEPKELGRVIAELEASGRSITIIEPVRRSLEDLFVDMVKGKTS